MSTPPLSRAPDRRAPRREPPAQRAASIAVVVAAHAGLGWALLQVDAVRGAVQQALPIFVSQIIEETKPEPLPPPPPPPPPPPKRRVVREEPPPLITAPPAPVPEPAPFVAPPPPPEPPPPVEVPAVVAAPPAPPPPAPVLVSDVAYVRPPAVTYPQVSRRLNETGVVFVRVLIDRNGAAAQVRIHRSSGYQRLDNAALDAVRGTLFRPYTENGVPAPAHALIPIRFELR